jgi:adenylyltransferase/sulfurtransferase
MVRLFGRKEASAPIPQISVRDLKRRLDRGEAVVVVDVRQPAGSDAYPGEIPGAVRLPPAELPDRFGELPRDRPLVLACT